LKVLIYLPLIYTFLSERQSYIETGTLEKWQRETDRYSFAQTLDSMSRQMAHRIKMQDPSFSLKEALRALQDEVDYFAITDLKRPWPRSLLLISAWLLDISHIWVVAKYQNLKANIDDQHDHVIKRYLKCLGDCREPNEDWLGIAMTSLIPEIRENL
jgi:tRNA(Ile)-lysidine synthase TilS/MesJ